MKAFFEGIQWLFENIIFIPQNYLRELELENWFAANSNGREAASVRVGCCT
jgi:hypothetical protein